MIKNSQKKTRIHYLDIARGFAIFGMFTQHCMLIHEISAGNGENFLANLFVLLGTAPSAPVFMLLMGTFLIGSKSSVGQNIWRGIKLLLLGFILNLLRFTVPLLIAVILTDNAINFPEGQTPLELLFYVDILQLAGLSLICCAFLKKIARKNLIIPFMIAIVLLVSPFLWGKFDSNVFSDLFWGNSETVSFPFFPWAIYPLLGMYLSRYLIGGTNIKINLKKMCWYGLILGIFGILMVILSALKLLNFDLFSPLGNYERSGAGIHLLIIGFVLLWLNVCYWLEHNFGVENPITKVLIYWSRNVTAIYFIQWLLFGWSILIFDSNQQNAFASALIGLVVLLITHFSVKSKRVRNLFAWV